MVLFSIHQRIHFLLKVFMVKNKERKLDLFEMFESLSCFSKLILHLSFCV